MTNLTDQDIKDINETFAESVPLPEAPMSTHIDAYYKGFHVGFTIRSEKNDVIPAAKSAAVIEQLISTGYKPSWNVQTNDANTPQPIAQAVDLSIDGPAGQGGKCPVHGTPLVWKSGISRTTNNPYAFWSCPTLNADGSFCRAASKK